MPDRPCIRCRILHGINETCNQAKARVARAAPRALGKHGNNRRGPPTIKVPVFDPAIDNATGATLEDKLGTPRRRPAKKTRAARQNLSTKEA